LSFVFKTCKQFLVKLSPSFTNSRSNLYVDFACRHLNSKANEKSLNLLDVGGSDGYLASQIYKKIVATKFNVFLIVLDSSISFIRSGKKQQRKIDFVCADVNHLPFKQDTFDMVCSFSVFEHLILPQAAVKEMVYVSRGLCVVQIPNMHYFVEPHTKAPLLYLLPRVIRAKIIRATSIPYLLNFDVIPKNLTGWFRQANYELTDFLDVYHARWTRLFRVPQGYLYAFNRYCYLLQDTCFFRK
jgi:2-polyprenyl-3-methyl-5-hydroxy-6-metoxy-1,4-benzoquinol methylase